MLRRLYLAAAIVLVLFLFPLLEAEAQTPIPLPYTMTTYAGLSPMSATSGAQCPNLPAGVVSTDKYGDGCLATNAILGAAAYGGALVDLQGNIYVVDDASSPVVVHKINPATGIMTLVAGAGTACSGKQSSYGDGCLAATGTALVSERSANIDYYGNILLGGYGSHLVHMICLNASPLCVSGTPSPTAANPLQIQIGYMGVVAGCAGNAGGQGTSGTGSENTPGFSYASYSVSAFKNSTACTASLGEVNKPEGITADVYGNVYYADSGVGRWRVVLGPQTYNGVTNPLYAILVKNTAWTTVTAGYVYTISGYPSTSATTPGGSCNGGGTATDGYGDGCLFTSSYGMGVTGYPTGMGVDAAGNMIYTDLNRGLRVFFVSDGSNFAAGTTGYIAGQRMKNAIVVNGLNYVTTSVAGFNYMLAGNGGTAIGTTTSATLGSQLSFDNKMYKLAVSPQGHVYIGDSGGPARVYFYDINTGYMRTLFTGSANLAAGTYCNGGTSGPVSLSKYSDGCPATKSLFSNSDSMSVGVDPQGNLYMYDGTEPVIRKVLAQGFSPQTLSTPGTALTQTFQIHLPEAAIGTASPATAAVSSSPDITVASGTNPTTPSCSQNADNTVDCTVTVTTTPSAVGQRSAALTVALPSGTWENASATINLNQTETGSVLVFDNAMLGGSSIALTPNAIFSSITPAAVAVDGAGNVYAASGTNIVEAIGSAYITLYSLSPSLSATPSQIAVDPTGNIFAVNRSVSTITELEVSAAGAPATYTATSVSYTPASGTAAPQAVATDQFGNLYVADYQTSGSSVYRLSWSPLSLTYQNQVTVASGLENPVSLAVDLAGNVFIADRTAGSISEYSPSMAVTTTTPLPLGTYSLAITHSMTAEAVAVDAGGNLYAQSGSDIYEIPVNGSEVAVYSGLSTPVGLAVDGLGNVYSADASKPSITQIVRNGLTCNFGTETTAGQATCGGTLTNAGNQVTTGSVAPSFFVLTGCGVNLNQIEALSAGEACELSTTMSGTATTPFTFLPAASTIGSVTLEGTLTAPHYATTTAITGPTEATPIYAASGTEATFTVTVAPGASSGYAGTDAPSGEPTVTVYSGTKTVASYTPSLSASGTSGIGTVYVSGLAAGNYTISANYGGGSTNGTVFDSSATSTVTSFTIGQVGTSVSGWTPSVTSQQVSAALGTSGVLNATATPSGVAGNFVYTATCTSGSGNCTQYSNTTIDAATYLPMGTYTLGVTFVPTDLTDYTASSSVTITGYTVTQASTTAAVGASTNVVASDGSGNYTTLSAALAALPVTGGTIYLKPGTYSGQNAISYPNVYLRGLGGDPTKVILTGENGAFSSPPTGFTLGPAGKGGDEGSATLDVSKNGYMGTTAASGSYSPYGFYADYLTIQNTYNTDLTTTSVNNGVTSSGTCTTTAATSLQTLYNSGTECGSQALAVWLGADQAILNNVNLTSQQDTLYAGYQGTSGSTYVPARQYIWQGLITGDVDYIFGDSALVLDHTNIFTTWHGTAATGTETITAQSKRAQTGSASDYLSGYICNACTLMSQTSTANGSAMTKLYYGRPYGVYSTFILLNSYADQVNPAGWVGWDGLVEYLSTSTYGEYNTQAYVDPAVGTAPYPSILFYLTTAAGGVVPSGGNIGYGVLSTSTPAAARESYALQLTPAQAVPYYPVNFLSTTVSTTGGYTGMPTTWNPVTALSAAVNFFAPTGNITLAAFNSSVTILGRPQTPGAGIIPTGSYAFYDSTSGATCTAATTNCTQLLSSNLDASGEAYLTTSTLAAGATHTITMVYGGDSNFAGSTSATFTITVPSATLTATTTNLTISNASSTYGGTISGIVSVAPTSGTGTPTGTVTLKSGGTTLGTCQLSGGSCSYALSNVASGSGQTMTANYSGDGTFGSSISNGVAFSVAPAVLTVTANNATMAVGSALPTFTYVITGYVNQDTSSVVSGIPALATTASSASSEGNYPITVSIGTLSASNYSFSSTGGILTVTGMLAVATGDSRTVTEPSFPAVCQQLNAAITSVSNDIPTSVDATNTNPDGARIQAALTSCAGSGKAVELSVDSTGVYNVFLSGPLSMPANVTLLVDPGVTLYFSRNAQDYDKVSGTHTCGTINTASATSSCLPLIDVPKTSTNAGIMGFGKVDGRGGDPLLNGFATSGYTEPSTYTWWTLASQADTDNGNQQNPRFIQLENGGSNFQLYKITILNSPMFHVSTVGSFAGFTAWDVKIVTPTDARNTDGIDPDQAQNFTITNSWISDGDDNIAVGASGSSSNVAKNISVTNNHFFAGHGESIGSYTSAGVSNVLFDNNMLWGNGSVDGNSTGIRIKSANDRGGVVSNIQYSNSCFQDHKTEIQFTPLYNSNSGSKTPNFSNILLQNLTFLTAGKVQFTGAVNGATTNPLQVTLDNVSFPSTFPASEFISSGSEGTETNAQLTYGPGDVTTSFINDWTTFAGSNGDTVTNNIKATTLNPPTCNFTAIAPELTGPSGLPQTIISGQTATAVVILTPAVGGAPYPTGTVTLTDALTGTTYQGNLSGTSDTIAIPLSGLTVGTHSFTATYSGDTNYTIASGQTVYSTAGPYVITVAPTALVSTTTALSGVPSTTTYGNSFTATATVTGNNLVGTVQFNVNGVVYASVSLASGPNYGTASVSMNLPVTSVANSIYAVFYSSDTVNAGSTSPTSFVTVAPATQTINFTAPASPVTYGVAPISLTATGGASGNPVVFSVTSGPGSISGSSLTITGVGQVVVAANQTASSNYLAAAQVTQSIEVDQAAAAVVLSNLARTYTGLPLSATATTTPTGLVVALTYNGSSTAPTVAGSYAVVATVNDPNYTGSNTGTLIITKATVGASVSSTANPVLLQNAVTFSATLSSAAGIPTGIVAFMDGTTVLGTSSLNSNGAATFTISSLTLGSHAVTAAYEGDTNFATGTSNSLTQLVEDFSLTSSGSSTATAKSGAAATFTFTLSPVGSTTLPAVVTLSASDLPTGATYSFSPTSLASGASATTVTLTLQLAQSTAMNVRQTGRPHPSRALEDARNMHGSKFPILALVFILLPFASRMRRAGRKLSRFLTLLLVLIGSFVTVVEISGCGGSSKNSLPPSTYTIVVIGTSGSLSHSTDVTLTVQ